jgi:hypothetical protein
MNRLGLCSAGICVAALLGAADASAADIGPPGEPLTISVHGFASQGFMLSTDNNYLAKTKNGSFEFSEIGLNFTVPITDKLRVGTQLFSRKLGAVGNFNIKADWFYLDYRFADWFGLRAGRTKLPFGLYNENSDIDAARVPILLPQSLYPVQSRDYLLAQTGVEAYGRVNLHAARALEYRLYGGTIFVDATSATGLQSLSVPYIVGGRLLWETPLEGLRAGGSVQALRLDGTATNPKTNTPLQFELPVILSVASIEYAAHDLLLSAEYSRWFVKTRTSDETTFPNASVVSERAYGMASYRASSWFQSGVYYAATIPDVHHRGGRQASQHDVATTMRFDINPHWLVKLEAHYMYGTADLSPALNDNIPLAALDRSWLLFLAKTTAYF